MGGAGLGGCEAGITQTVVTSSVGAEQMCITYLSVVSIVVVTAFKFRLAFLKSTKIHWKSFVVVVAVIDL